MPDDLHLDELMRQCADATPLGRLTGIEQRAVFGWLLDGHVTRTGKPLQRPRSHPPAIARKPDGSPIYDAGADFSTHQTVNM